MLANQPRLAAPHHPGVPRGAAPRTAIIATAPRNKFPSEGGPNPQWAARRAQASGQSAPSNTRLKLAAPGSCGTLPFVSNQARRRSLSAVR